MITRPHFGTRTTIGAIAAIALLAASGCSSDDAGTEQAAADLATVGASECQGKKITVTRVTTTFVYMPSVVAEVGGYFEELGLEVEPIDLGASAESLAAVASGSADVALVGLSQILESKAKGAPISAIGTITYPMGLQIVLKNSVAEEHGINADSSHEDKVAALSGLRIGYTSPGSTTDNSTRYLLKEEGIDPDKDVTLMQLGAAGPATAAFIQGEVDAINYAAPASNLMMEEGDGMLLFNLGNGDVKGLENYDGVAAAANVAEMEKDPVKYACYLAGLERAMWDLAEDPEGTAAKAQDAFGEMDPDLFFAGLATSAGSFPETTEISESQAEGAVAFANSFGAGLSDETAENGIARQLAEPARRIADDRE